MTKFTEFYTKAVVNDEVMDELVILLDGKKLNEASDEQLARVSEIAKKMNIDISVEEAKVFMRGGRTELSDDELDAVAGGTAKGNPTGNPFVFAPSGSDEGIVGRLGR